MKTDKVSEVLILGMHRSGTSMLAGVLVALGVDMGEEWLGRHWSNPYGHFEDVEFLELNRRLLQSAGGRWDCPPNQDEIRAQEASFVEETQGLIKQKRSSSIWGWKDPRTSLTIELYLPHLSDPYFIVCYRDRESIARSLNRRNNKCISEALELTRAYEEKIATFFKDYSHLPKLELKYEEMLAYPVKTVDDIIGFLGLEVTEQQYQNALQFIKPRNEVNRLSKIMQTRARVRKMFLEGIRRPWKIPRFLLGIIRRRIMS